MSETETRSSPLRAARMAAGLFLTLFVARIVSKWITVDSVDAWVAWLRGEWLSELFICVLAAMLVSISAIFGLSNNRYVDRG